MYVVCTKKGWSLYSQGHGSVADNAILLIEKAEYIYFFFNFSAWDVVCCYFDSLWERNRLPARGADTMVALKRVTLIGTYPGDFLNQT